MKFGRLGLMNKNQLGLTLLELMLAMAISSIIAGGLTMTIFQMFTGGIRSNNHMIAVNQAENAGYWVSRDAQMAQSIIFDDPATGGVTEFFTLTWTDWDSNDAHRIAYVLLDIPDSEVKNLQRSHSRNGNPIETGIIAQFIDPDPAKTKREVGGTFTLPDSGDAFTITGGAVADSGTITVAPGSISVTVDGGATYSGGATGGTWTTPAAGGTVRVSAGGAGAAGVWTTTMAGVTVAITADANGNAAAIGKLTFTVTITLGAGSQAQSETRTYEIAPRPGLW